MEHSLDERIEAANELLAPYAVPIQGKLGRVHDESEDDTRFPFQRDKDRIVETNAYRRLIGKTQVFVTGEGDHYRNRLTHTYEVASLSRGMARVLRLNEDLAECIALAHDLGHPPFGHAGEEAIDEWLKPHGFRFEHNQQSHRIVTLLETHCNKYRGLNLNQEVLDGLLKHQTVHDQPQKEVRPKTLEAQLVNIADEISYTAHDTDDGLREGAFTLDEIIKIPLAQQANEMTKKRGTALRGALITLLTSDIYDNFDAQDPSIAFSKDMQPRLAALRKFLWEQMYMKEQVLNRNETGKVVLTNIMDRLRTDPTDEVKSLQEITHGALEEAIKDYTAGMTERFAVHFSVQSKPAPLQH